MTARRVAWAASRLAAAAGLLAVILLVAVLGGVALACCVDQLIGA